MRFLENKELLDEMNKEEIKEMKSSEDTNTENLTVEEESAQMADKAATDNKANVVPTAKQRRRKT